MPSGRAPPRRETESIHGSLAIAEDFGPIALPPTDPRYVDGGPRSEVPGVAGLISIPRGRN